ncbi:MAG TPA: hypothetical protein VGB13_01505 [Candidatus Krumholzibacteria bacterium]
MTLLRPGTVGLTCCAVCAVAACQGGVDDQLVVRQDSAGVSIVESSGPEWSRTAGWTLDSIASFALSGSGAAYEFARVTDATFLSNGQLVVLDEGAHQARFFDREGVFVRAVGREGEGPGDFSGLSSVFGLRGDSVLVYDSWLRRATILDSAGAVARIVTLPADLQAPELFPITGDGFVAKAWSLTGFMDVAGAYRADYAIVRLDEHGAVRDTLARMPGWNGYKVNTEGGGYRDYAPLFPLDGHAAIRRGDIVLGGAERVEFRSVSAEGELRSIARAPSLDRPFDAAEVEAERAAMIRPTSSAEHREIVRGLPAPASRPYSDLLVDADGYVWLAAYASQRTHADDPVRWHIFHPDGAWQGDLVTPARFTVFEIGADYILGVRRDEYDVQHIETLSLAR